MRYELIAKKIHRAADGTASEWDITIVKDWLQAMQELEALTQARSTRDNPSAPAVPFAGVRTGKVQNPNYQAFLDTLEQDELDSLQSNGPFFAWMAKLRMNLPSGQAFTAAYIRECANASLSRRAQAQVTANVEPHP